MDEHEQLAFASTEDSTSKRKPKTYRDLGQGIKIFHDHEYADVDILAVPGLGTDPEECWTWDSRVNKEESLGDLARAHAKGGKPNREMAQQRKRFNWLRDRNGLAALFPQSRIMLYNYASAWSGRYKVRATMREICTSLLAELSEKRKFGGETTRPLILIGHSMGGVVITKMICMAKARAEYEAIVTCTMGCLFFGSPFRGSNMAKLALAYNSVLGNEAYESLLEFLKSEKNDALDEVTNDFMEISNKLNPPVDILCVWEKVPTSVAYSDKIIPEMLQQSFFKSGIKKILDIGLSAMAAGTYFVDMNSAILPGFTDLGMTATHSDLVKFESIEMDRFAVVRSRLKMMVQTARMNARKRTSALGQRLITQRFINQVRDSLQGVDMKSKYRAMVGDRAISTWLSSVPQYEEWKKPSSRSDPKASPYLWIKGGPGLRKTNTCLATIQHIQGALKTQSRDADQTHADSFVAYFLCDWSAGFCTAEDVLKSLIVQTIDQEESLAQHGKWFVPNSRKRGLAQNKTTQVDDQDTSGSKATTTVDNLWNCLQDMLNDPIVNNFQIVISNIHCLESTGSTNALLSKIAGDAADRMYEPTSSRRVKWMITSRSEVHIQGHLQQDSITLIDMENDSEYGAKIKQSWRQHASDAVARLQQSAGYGADLAYFIRTTIEHESRDETWTDVLCILLTDLLAELGRQSSDLAIRRWLTDEGRRDTRKLVEITWNTILDSDRASALELAELLRLLTITFEPPTVADLAVITFQTNRKRLIELIDKCSPIIIVGVWNGQSDRVVFSHTEFSNYFRNLWYGRDDDRNRPEERQHGVIALRCFEHIQRYYRLNEDLNETQVVPRIQRRPVASAGSTFPGDSPRPGNVSPVSEASSSESATSVSSSYALRYLFRHLGKAPPDVVEDLYRLNRDFWGSKSGLNGSWLKDFQSLTSDLKDLNVAGMSALHVAAAIGANEVVTILVRRNGRSVLSWKSEDGITALHVAAQNNHGHVVENLLKIGAEIEAGDGEAGTALHLAALYGHGAIMDIFIKQGANVNAISRKVGPVINAAIYSGSVDAVKRALTPDIRFDLDYTAYDAPLSLSAGYLEPSVFHDILELGKDKWAQNHVLVDQAIVFAAEAGRLESLNVLLKFQNTYSSENFVKAMEAAAYGKKWQVVMALLGYMVKQVPNDGITSDVPLGNVFYLAAIDFQDQIDVMEGIWNFPRYRLPDSVRDFSMYQAAALKKDVTVDWLLFSCDANANTGTQKPKEIDARFLDGETFHDFLNPLNAAARAGNSHMVESLIRAGAKIDDANGYSLHLAAGEGFLAIVESLLGHGAAADRQARDNDALAFYKGTALQAACENNKVEIVGALIRHGANPNLGGGSFTNPITAATRRVEPEILQLLLDAPGIDINVKGGENGSTPLINAATNMSAQWVELLVKRGAAVDAHNRDGDTALIMAAWKGDVDCVEMLCENNADVTYRSPRQGLPIQVASNRSHARCAHILAERMNRKITEYHEEAQKDPSKEKLIAAHAALNERDDMIRALKARLAEVMEQHDSTERDFAMARLKIDQINSESRYQGTAFESITRELNTIKLGRYELEKQLESSKGQASILRVTIDKLQSSVAEEKQRHIALKKEHEQEATRWTLTTIYNQKLAEMQKTNEELRQAMIKNEELQQKNEMLHTVLQRMRKETLFAQSKEQIAKKKVESEKQRTIEVQEEVENLTRRIQEMGNAQISPVEVPLDGAAEIDGTEADHASSPAESEHFEDVLPATEGPQTVQSETSPPTVVNPDVDVDDAGIEQTHEQVNGIIGTGDSSAPEVYHGEPNQTSTSAGFDVWHGAKQQDPIVREGQPLAYGSEPTRATDDSNASPAQNSSAYYIFHAASASMSHPPVQDSNLNDWGSVHSDAATTRSARASVASGEYVNEQAGTAATSPRSARRRVGGVGGYRPEAISRRRTAGIGQYYDSASSINGGEIRWREV